MSIIIETEGANSHIVIHDVDLVEYEEWTLDSNDYYTHDFEFISFIDNFESYYGGR